MKLINPLIIIRILGTILLVETISFLACLPVALIYKESLLPFLWSSVITGALHIIFKTISIKADLNDISNRDGYVAVTLSWLLFAVMGTLPYIISGTIPSFINAFFESTSGFTTTGATVVADIESLPFSILFWRSLTHWIGGIGIIVLVIIILPSLRISGYQLFTLESSMQEKIHPKTQAVGFRIMIIYIGLTLAETILLNMGDMTLFDSICHSFGTISTGGFSTRNTSLQFYSAYSQYIVMIFMFLAGVSFVVYYYLVKLKFNKVRKNEELWFYIVTTLIAGLFMTIALLIHTNKPPEIAFREGFFQVVSIITTTGFKTTDYLLWPPGALLMLFLLLFAGASTGSTAGSIKMARHLVVIKNIKLVFRKLIHPNILSQIRLNNNPLSERTNLSVLSFVVLYLFIFLVGTAIIVLTGSDPVTSASAVASCLGNIGPGLGSVGPMFTYAHMPQISLFTFSTLMIIGRLEIFAIFALFSKSFWKL
jgi:trk system potassium uptake protein TrkH